MFLLFPKTTLTVFVLPFVLCVLLAIIGGIHAYTPVPLQDMWQSLLLVVKIEQGDYSVWWEQHNEHRILLTRALFWLDYVFFQGRGYFLEIVNYLLLCIIYLTLFQCLQERLSTSRNTLAKKIIALVMLTGGASWLQHENLIWTFQSQFLLAQLLPLWAFYCLHKAHVTQEKSSLYFLLACLAGVCALGSMANGVLTLPLLALFAVILKMGWRKITGILLLAACGLVVYFYDYQSPASHGSLKNALLYHPVAFVEYILLYLGGPFYFLFGQQHYLFAQVAGALLILSSLGFAIRCLKQAQQSSLELALLIFLLYVGGSVFATAGGRVIFGIQQALSWRYMTPALMAWSIMLILYAPTLIKKMASKPVFYYGALFVLQLVFLVLQCKVLEPRARQGYEYKVAALAVELGINDKQQINHIFPNALTLLTLSQSAIDKNIGIFAYPGIKDARDLIGKTETYAAQACIGSVDSYQRLDDQRYVRIAGWMFDQHSNQKPQFIHMLNDAGMIIGGAFTGWERDDLQDQIHVAAKAAGFKGYVLADYVGQQIHLNGHNPDCHFLTAVSLSVEERAEAQLETLGQNLGIKMGASNLRKPENSANFAMLTEVKIPIGGTVDKLESALDCQIKLHEYRDIVNDSRFVRFQGQLEYPKQSAGELLQIVDDAARVAGYGITSTNASKEQPVSAEGKLLMDFNGYLLAQHIGKPLNVNGLLSKCTAQVLLKRLPFSIKKVNSIHFRSVVYSSQIMDNNQWLGTDAQNTQLQGYKVWGSYIQSDQDMGAIALAMHRGDSVFYRSGPTGGRQKLFISGQPESFLLPAVSDWVTLEFSDAQLPANFTVTLVDAGNEWGEWSALGLKN